ncbi:MAG TPA: glycosyl hydrolase family 28-related protein, partial [Methanosarcina sp.]|nr:glycosyl hydrolase family 28-related protein [Methanosarcina sp.]
MSIKLSNMSDIGTPQSTDNIYVARSPSYGRTTLSTIGNWILQTFTGFIQAGTGSVLRTFLSKTRENVSVKDFGAVGDGVTDDTAAINLALASGAKSVFIPKGTYLVSSSLLMQSGQTLHGEGEQDTIIQAVGSITVLPLTQGRETLRDFCCYGPSTTPASYTGTGVEVGTTLDWTAHVTIERVMCRYFTRGLSLKAALWFTCLQGRFQYNTYGVDFNASAGKYSTTVSFIDTKFGNNQRNGVAATAVPTGNRTVTFKGGSIENNCLENPASYAQMMLGSCGNLSIDNVYFESAGTGGFPDAINLTGVSNASINIPYINGSTNGIVASSNSCNNITILDPRFVATQTSCINLPSCQHIIVFHPIEDKNADVLTGAYSTTVNYKLAQLEQQASSFTPAITGGGTNAHTYVWQNGTYTKVGNVVSFSIALRLSAKDAGMTGNATITG